MYLFWIMFIFLSLYIFRIVRGPSIWDRLLGYNLLSTKVVIIIIIFASFHETAYYLDFAIMYVLLGFLGTIFTARFVMGRIREGK